ncbi:hypothetical protein SDC9_140881 [bioreactor metagenome]|uniref:Uncharacterized protein n=1 Tax=bioreactor metagenome TaxID=1076179 RepID=A0A645DWT9_9ZZZZ
MRHDHLRLKAAVAHRPDVGDRRAHSVGGLLGGARAAVVVDVAAHQYRLELGGVFLRPFYGESHLIIEFVDRQREVSALGKLSQGVGSDAAFGLFEALFDAGGPGLSRDEGQHGNGGGSRVDVERHLRKIKIFEHLVRVAERRQRKSPVVVFKERRVGIAPKLRAVVELEVKDGGAFAELVFHGLVRLFRQHVRGTLGDLPRLSDVAGALCSAQERRFSGHAADVEQLFVVGKRIDRFKGDAFVGRREHPFVERSSLEGRHRFVVPLFACGNGKLFKGDRRKFAHFHLCFVHITASLPDKV